MQRSFCIGVLLLAWVLLGLAGCSSDSGLTVTGPGTPAADDDTSEQGNAPGSSSTTIGIDGGTASSADGTRVHIPPGALTEARSISITEVVSPPAMSGHTPLGTAKSLSPDGLWFQRPVELELPVGDSAEGTVRVVTYDASAGAWVEVPGSLTDQGRASVQIAHFSMYAAATRTEGDPAGGRIVGYVKSGGQGVHGAQVKVLSGPSREGESVTTGEQGGYELEGLEPGAYKVEVSREGYVTQVAEGIEVAAGESTRRDFELSVDGDAKGAIVGHVRNVEGQPIVEAKVTIIAGPEDTLEKSAFTNGDGLYELSGLPPGTYALRASREGHESKAEDGIVVEAGQATEVNFVLVATDGGGDGEKGRIVGHVRNGEGHPIGEAKLVVVAGPEGTLEKSTFTNADGVYELERLPPGTYAVKASREGYDSKTEDGIVVTAGKDTEVNFVLSAAESDGKGRIVGRVRDAEEKPINDAKVEIVVGPGDTVGKSTHTGAEGVYELEQLPAGTYAVKVSREGYKSKTEDGIVVQANKDTEVHFTLEAG